MTTSDSKANFPADVLPRLAGVLHAEHFSTGDRAALKRVGIKGETPLAYFRFLLQYVPEEWQKPWHELAWRTAISALAMQHGNPHDPNRSLGSALAEMGFAEMRLESLLGAEGRVRATLALRAARRLGVERARWNCRDFGWLLFAQDQEGRDRINERVARDFYRVVAANKRTAA